MKIKNHHNKNPGIFALYIWSNKLSSSLDAVFKVSLQDDISSKIIRIWLRNAVWSTTPGFGKGFHLNTRRQLNYDSLFYITAADRFSHSL